MSIRDMDLEHPDITCALRTGYPREVSILNLKYCTDDVYLSIEDDEQGGEENGI